MDQTADAADDSDDIGAPDAAVEAGDAPSDPVLDLPADESAGAPDAADAGEDVQAGTPDSPGDAPEDSASDGSEAVADADTDASPDDAPPDTGLDVAVDVGTDAAAEVGADAEDAADADASGLTHDADGGAADGDAADGVAVGVEVAPDAPDEGLDGGDDAIEVIEEPTCPYFGQGLVGLPTNPAQPRFVDMSAYAAGGGLHLPDQVFGGVAVVDLDLDGAADIVYTADEGRVGVLRNCGDGTFYRDWSASALWTVRRARVVNYADLDNDGDPDLYVGANNRAYLFLNNGDATFEDVSSTWGIGVLSGRGGASFADFDGDGRLDLYETSYESRRNRLRRNRGNHFEEISVTPGNSPDMGTSLGVAWTDINRDGRPDLHVVNDFGMTSGPNHFYLNQGPDPTDTYNWLFEDVGVESGFQVAIFGMGTAFGDYDNDGDLDAYTGNITRNVLHRVDWDDGPCPDGGLPFCVNDQAQALGVGSGQVNLPGDPGTWPDYDPSSGDSMEAALAPFCEDYCDTTGTSRALASWSPVFFDADQNGWLDLFITNGWVYFSYMPMAGSEPNYLFLNTAGAFTTASTAYLPTTTGTSRGSAVGDLDGDGDLELLWLDNGRVGAGGLRVYENRAATGHWLRVQLVGTTSNRDAIGARLTLHAGSLTLTREVDGGQGFASASERYPHFGLGTNAEVDSLEIVWPSGTVQTLTNLDVDQWLVVEEPSDL